MGTRWLAGRVAVVTGASRGIGLATAKALSAVGAHVVLAARDAVALEREAAAIRGSGGDATPVACDVAVPERVDALFDAAEDIGGLGVLVCCAAVLTKAPLDELAVDRWRLTIDTNLTGTFLCCRRALAAMKRAGGGRIVTVSSLSGVYPVEKFPGLGAYNVSKYGVIGLTEMLAVEGRDHGVTAICVSPGAVDTSMLREAAPHLKPGLGPDDVARLIVALLDDAMTPASGANIPLFSNR